MRRRDMIAGAGALALAGCAGGTNGAKRVDRRAYFTAADGVRIAWREYGRADGAPIFFCTMGTAAMAVWEPATDVLARDFRIVLHDRRGNGDSDPGAPETHSFETFRDDALGVMTAAGLSSAAVCGMAFGARVATRMAMDATPRVSRLMLFDATGGPAAPEAERLAASAEAKRLRDAAGIATPERNPAWFARRDPAGAPLNGAALRGHPAWVSGLETISAPTLVACGDHDPNLPGSRRLAQEIPGARLELMEMTGHASILDRPDVIAALIADFMKA